jgi:beta-glucosidase-like glycosyl hydrolase
MGALRVLSLILSFGLVFNPIHLFAQSASEQRVNEHLQKTHKKIEIDGQKREVELRKNAPSSLTPQTPKKKKSPFIVNPTEQHKEDPEIYSDHYDHSAGKDPVSEVEQNVLEQRAVQPEMTNEEFVKQFKENAAKAGVKIEVDPKTLKAKPVK